MESGSKVISFRLPVDLAGEFEKFCDEAGVTSGEVLRKFVDEKLYPGAEMAAPALYSVEANAEIVAMVNAQIKEQLEDQLGSMVDAHLELVQVDRALTEAEKAHYNESLASLESGLANLKAGVNKLVGVVNDNVEAYEGISRTVNKNVELCNESFDRVRRLFQILESHTHDGDGQVKISDLLATEVAQAEKRVGELPGDTTRPGKVEKKGWKYMEHLGISVRE